LTHIIRAGLSKKEPPMNTTSELGSNASGVMSNSDEGIAIISLRPKDPLLHYVRGLAKQVLHENDRALDKILDKDYLEVHAVPVCTRLYKTHIELEDFLHNNYDVLVNLMLTSWMWPINKWGFDAQDKGTIESLMATEYRPFVYQAMNTIKDPTTLAVTYANPTRALVEDLVGACNSRREGEEAIEKLRFKVRSGLAIITDRLDRTQYHSPVDYCVALANPLNYLKLLNDNVGKELLLSFYGHEEDLPKLTGVEHLSKWFHLTTNLGLYMLTKPWMASRYRRCVHASDNDFF
jgi:hypothetical protein